MIPRSRKFFLPATFILCALFMTVSGMGQSQIALDDSGAAGPALEVVRSDLSGSELGFQLSALDSTTVSTNAGTFSKISIEDYGFTHDVGSPLLPAVREFVEIPHGGTYELILSNAVFVEYSLAELELADRIFPAQPPLPKSQATRTYSNLVIDAAIYGSNSWVLDGAASITDEVYLRDRRLVTLQINPVNYNPAAGKVRILKSATLNIVMNGADGDLTHQMKTRYSAPSFNQTAGKVVLNSAAFDTSVLGKQSRASRATGYLMIAAPAYVSNASLLDLVNLRTAEGFDVTLVDTNTTGTSTTAIKNYIQTAYNTWNPAPEFVLLVGDTNTIPAWSGSGTGSPTTDLNYACVQGTDYIPDISRGRLPVRSSTQLNNLCGKIIDMATMEVKDAVFMASEDRYTVSEGTHNYVISNYLDPAGWTSDKLYCHTYNATTSQVTNAFNDGRTLGTFSGHGYSGGWSDGPPFNQNNVRALVNTVYPFVQSYSCSTAPFANTECFGETWVVDNHGATSFFGASLSSYWDEDDILEKRLYRGWIQYGNDRVGPAIDYGQYELYLWMGTGSFTRMYFEMYNLLGEPAMALLGGGGSPGDLTVEIVMGATSYSRGDTATYDLSIINGGGSSETTYFWTNVTLPNGATFPGTGYLNGPISTTVNGGDTQVWSFSRRIPLGAPLGSYLLNGFIGDNPPTPDDDDSFSFSVTN